MGDNGCMDIIDYACTLEKNELEIFEDTLHACLLFGLIFSTCACARFPGRDRECYSLHSNRLIDRSSVEQQRRKRKWTSREIPHHNEDPIKYLATQ